MASDLVELPKKVKDKMRAHPEIDWEMTISQFVEQYINQLEFERANKLAESSKLTTEDVDQLSKKIEKKAWEKFKAKYLNS